MYQFNIGDKVSLLPPFITTRVYTIVAINGLYLTLARNEEHKNLVIYFKCIREAQQQPLHPQTS